MEKLLEQALSAYGLVNTRVEFLRHNENMTYRLTDTLSGKKYVLRIHKSSDSFSLDMFGAKQHSFECIKSEMEILYAIHTRTDLLVQTPIKNRLGEFVTMLRGDIPATLLTWVDGEILEKVHKNRQTYYNIGEMTGRLHYFFKNWEYSNDMKRYYYDQQLLFSIHENMKQAAKCDIIKKEHEMIIQKALVQILHRMKELDFVEGSKGLTHADLSQSNMLYSRGKIVPIDFCLCGFSYYYMDLGSLFNYFFGKEERRLILQGYVDIAGIEIQSKYIEAFMALQIILYISSHYEKSGHLKWFQDGVERWCRETFVPLIENIPFAL